MEVHPTWEVAILAEMMHSININNWPDIPMDQEILDLLAQEKKGLNLDPKKKEKEMRLTIFFISMNG